MLYPDNLICRVVDDGRTVFATLDELETETRTEFESFLDDVDSVVPIDLETGLGPFPSFQLVQLENFTPESILTKYVATDTYEFDITIQNITYEFSVLGSSMPTFADVIAEVNANIAGATVSYVPMTNNSHHFIVITSNTVAVGADLGTDSNMGVGVGMSSHVTVTKFLNINENKSDNRSAGSDEQAVVSIQLPPHTSDCVVTGLDTNTSYDIRIAVGQTTASVVGTGAELTTYDNVIDLINTIPNVTATYDLAFPRANQVAIVGGIDVSSIDENDFADELNPSASFNAAITQQLAENFNQTIAITSFDIFAAMQMDHSLKLPVHGGADLTDVIKYSYRGDRLVWREAIPFEWSQYYWGVAPGT